MRSGCGGDTRHVLLDRESIGIGISAELTNADVRIHCGEFACQGSQTRRFENNCLRLGRGDTETEVIRRRPLNRIVPLDQTRLCRLPDIGSSRRGDRSPSRLPAYVRI